MKRNPGENFEDYQERRKEEKLRIKGLLKGRFVWYSKHLYNYTNRSLNRGTYTWAEHGELS